MWREFKKRFEQEPSLYFCVLTVCNMTMTFIAKILLILNAISQGFSISSNDLRMALLAGSDPY